VKGFGGELRGWLVSGGGGYRRGANFFVGLRPCLARNKHVIFLP